MPFPSSVIVNNEMNCSDFDIPESYRKYLSSVLIPHGMIIDRVRKMAIEINGIYPDNEEITLLCVLKGGFRFCSALIEQLSSLRKKPVSVEFLRLKSYHDDKSTGNVQVIGQLVPELCKDKNVLIVEDIIDTGKTMCFLVDYLKSFSPRTTRIATLLWKELEIQRAILPDMVGFTIPDAFVIGFGLDYNEYFRDLNHIAIINHEGKSFFAKK